MRSDNVTKRPFQILQIFYFDKITSKINGLRWIPKAGIAAAKGSQHVNRP